VIGLLCWDNNGTKSKSNFSIGSLDSEVSPSDNGKVLRASRNVGNAPKVSTLLSPKEDGLRRRKSEEHKKSSLEVNLEDSLQGPYLGRQRCESVASEPARKKSIVEEQRKMSKVEEQQKTTTESTTSRTLEDIPGQTELDFLT
jgi:hypothetical protein